MNRPLLSALQKLRSTDDGQLSASALTRAQQDALDEFCQRTGALQLQRSGRGRVFRILRHEVVAQHIAELAPATGTELSEALPVRASNIGRTRSSKGGKQGHEVFYLLVKTLGKPHWENQHGQILDLHQQTQTQGVAALAIGARSAVSWQTKSPIWLVENQALFDELNWLPEQRACTVGWYSGHLRNALIHWLGQQKDIPVILFPDYDGVGLHNYLRLKQRLGPRASLWLMPDWQRKLKKYGSNALWQKTQSDFQVAVKGLAVKCSAERELQQLIETMQTHGMALEQEAVWL
ncbi:MAG: hypothetical protein JXQ97_05720 [Natronospirillum sp.]